MREKDEVIHGIMRTLDIENRLRDAYNEGFLAGQEKTGLQHRIAEAYQNGVSDGERHLVSHLIIHDGWSTAEGDRLDVVVGERSSDFYSNGYNDGLDEAWEAAKKIFAVYSAKNVEDIFGDASVDNLLLFNKFSVREVIKMIRDYEEENRKAGIITVGDQVTVDGFGGTAVVTWIDNNSLHASILFDLGGVEFLSVSKLHKTGKHFPVNEWLEQLREK